MFSIKCIAAGILQLKLSCLWQWKSCFQRQIFFIFSMQYTYTVFKDLHVVLASVVPTASWVILGWNGSHAKVSGQRLRST